MITWVIRARNAVLVHRVPPRVPPREVVRAGNVGRIRYYDPAVGRWAQRDPIQNPFNPRSWNPYAYVGQDPCNRVDPTGAHDEAYEEIANVFTAIEITCAVGFIATGSPALFACAGAADLAAAVAGGESILSELFGDDDDD